MVLFYKKMYDCCSICSEYWIIAIFHTATMTVNVACCGAEEASNVIP